VTIIRALIFHRFKSQLSAQFQQLLFRSRNSRVEIENLLPPSRVHHHGDFDSPPKNCLARTTSGSSIILCPRPRNPSRPLPSKSLPIFNPTRLNLRPNSRFTHPKRSTHPLHLPPTVSQSTTPNFAPTKRGKHNPRPRNSDQYPRSKSTNPGYR
jgi:hypothetical protein